MASDGALSRAVLHRKIARRRAQGQAGEVGADAAGSVERAAASAGGQPLPGELRRKFEGSLGADLGAVRVHTSAASQEAAASVGALAYTSGNDIHFAQGQFDPSSSGGERLLAHETAHTVQQAAGGAAGPQHKLEVSMPGDAHEVEADRAAEAMIGGAPAQLGASSGALDREPDPAAADATSRPANPAELAKARRANGVRRTVLGSAIAKLDGLLTKRPAGGSDGDGTSGAPPMLSSEEQRVVEAFRRQMCLGPGAIDWDVMAQARALMAQNLAKPSDLRFFTETPIADYAHVHESCSPTEGMWLGSFLEVNDDCQNEVITHEYFHFVVGLGHHYGTSNTSEALRCPHHLAELVFDIATGCTHGCESGACQAS